MPLEPVDMGSRLQNEQSGFDSHKRFQVLLPCSVTAAQELPNLLVGVQFPPR